MLCLVLVLDAFSQVALLVNATKIELVQGGVQRTPWLAVFFTSGGGGG